MEEEVLVVLEGLSQSPVAEQAPRDPSHRSSSRHSGPRESQSGAFTFPHPLSSPDSPRPVPNQRNRPSFFTTFALKNPLQCHPFYLSQLLLYFPASMHSSHPLKRYSNSTPTHSPSPSRLYFSILIFFSFAQSVPSS